MDSPITQPESRVQRGWQRRLRRVAMLALVVLAFVAGGVNLAQLHLDKHIRDHVEAVLSKANPHLLVQVDRARRVNSKVIEVRGLVIGNPGDPAPFLLIDEAQIVCDTTLTNLLRGSRLDITAIQLYRPRVRAKIASDGSCDLAKLIAFPRSTGRAAPVRIVDGEIELSCECDRDWATLRIRDVNLQVVQTEASAEGPGELRVRGRFGGDHLGNATFDYRRESSQGAWTISGVVEDFEFSEDLLKNVPAPLAAKLQPLKDLRATTNFTYAAADFADDRPLQYRLNGRLRDGRIADPAFPYAFTDLEAAFTYTQDGIELNQMRAKSGQAEILLSYDGEIESGRPFRLTGTAERLPLDDRLASTLPDDVRRIWNRFDPVGEIGAKLTLDYDGVGWTPELEIDVRRLDFTFDSFPYRIDAAKGSMNLRGDQLTIDLHTTISGQRANLDGQLKMIPGARPVGWMELSTEGPIPFDEKLIRALKPEHQRVVRSLNATGLIQCQARFERNERTGFEWSKKIHVFASRGAIQYERAPYPINRIEGRIEFHDDGWTLHHAEGFNDAAYVTAKGRYHETGEGGDLSLTIRGVDVPLDNSLRLALPEHHRDVWANVRPRGALDELVIKVEKPAWSEEPSFHVTAKKGVSEDARGAISVLPRWLPYRWDRVSGEFDYRNGALILRDIRGVHGRAVLTLDGEGDFSDQAWRMDLTQFSLENAHADAELISAMRPERLRQALSQSRIAGPIRMEGRIGFAGRRNSKTVTSHWDLYVDLENGSLRLGMPVRAIRGGVRFRGGYDGQRLNSIGLLSVDSMLVQNVHLTRVHGPLWIDDNRLLFGADAYSMHPELKRQSVLARAHEGDLSIDGQVGLTGTNAFHVNVRMDRGNLASISQQFGSQTDTIAGQVRGRLDLWGNARGSHTWSGRGEVHLTEADIYELPVMIGMFKLLSVKRPDNTAFTNADAFFRVQGEHLYFDRVDFSGDIVTLRGTGEMDLERNVNMQFYAAIGRDRLFIPVVRPLLGETSRSFLLIEVGGVLDKPDVRRTAFPEISERLRQLLPPDVSQQSLRPPLLPGLEYVIPESLQP